MTEKEQLTHLIKDFFQRYATRILTDAGADAAKPSEVKQALLEHYERIFPAFVQELPYPIMRITYTDSNEAEATLRKSFAQDGVEPMALLRTACRTDELFQHLSDTYRQCFSTLLEGRVTF